MKKRPILVMGLLAVGAAAAVLLVANAGPLGRSRQLWLRDCRPRKLATMDTCRGQDSSFQECRYYLRATGTPDVAWCRAMLAAADRPEEPTACDLESPRSWAVVDCGRYGLSAFDRCFLCVTGEPEARRTYVHGYDRRCTEAAEQVTCHVDPVEAGRLLSGMPREESGGGRVAGGGRFK